MDKIVAASLELAGGDPIEISFLGSVIIGTIKKGEETDGMPAKGINIAGRNFCLAIVIGDRSPEKAAPVRGAQSLEGIGIEAGSANSREDRIEEMLGQNALLFPRSEGGRIYHFA